MMDRGAPEAPSGLWLIGELHNAFREAFRCDEPQPGAFALAEERSPLPYHEWMDREIDAGKQVVIEQRLSEQTMAIDEQISPLLLLQPGHFSHHIASNDGRIAPLGCFQRRGEDILRDGIDPVGPWVGPS